MKIKHENCIYCKQLILISCNVYAIIYICVVYVKN